MGGQRAGVVVGCARRRAAESPSGPRIRPSAAWRDRRRGRRPGLDSTHGPPRRRRRRRERARRRRPATRRARRAHRRCRPPRGQSACPDAAASGGRRPVPRRASRPASCGRRIEKRAPRPAPSLATVTDPPCSSVSSFTIASPRPSPPWSRVIEPSACRKRSKTCGRNAGAMPIPVSRTSSCVHAVDLGSDNRHGAAGGVNLTAFDSRFHTICCRRSASPSDRGTARRQVAVDRDAASPPPLGSDRPRAPLDDRREVDGVRSQPQLAGDDARDVEQVVDQRRLRAGVARRCSRRRARPSSGAVPPARRI